MTWLQVCVMAPKGRTWYAADSSHVHHTNRSVLDQVVDSLEEQYPSLTFDILEYVPGRRTAPKSIWRTKGEDE